MLRFFRIGNDVCHAGIKEDRTRFIEKKVAEFGGFDIFISNGTTEEYTDCMQVS
jgi:hypothetical protein